MAKVHTTEQQKKNQLPEEMHRTNVLRDRNVNQPPAFFVTEFRNNDIFQAITPLAFRVCGNHNKDEKMEDLFFVWTEIGWKSFLTKISRREDF